MRKTKDELLIELVAMKDEIALILPELKIKEGHLDVHENADRLPITVIKGAHVWLTDIFSGAFYTLRKTRKLLTPAQWARYELWGEDFDDHREAIMLREAKIVLRKVLVSQDRPVLFKKGVIDEFFKVHTKKRDESDSVGKDGDSKTKG